MSAIVSTPVGKRIFTKDFLLRMRMYLYPPILGSPHFWQPDKRTRLIETATKLAYGRGFRETSLADIAEAARVPVGNVYYYFKTKEELAEAVVERRLEEFRAARAEWDRLSSPKERLLAFVGSVQANREQLAR